MNGQASAHVRPIHFVRWSNFRALLASRNLTITAAAALMGKFQAQVSTFGGRNPGKAIGSQIAADIEAAFGLPDGWLDRNGLADDPGFQAVDDALLGQAEDWLQYEESALGKYQPIPRLRRAISLLNLIKLDGGRLTPFHAAELIEAVRAQIVGANSSSK